MKTLKAQKPIAGNSIQITGGEPMLRDDITELIRIMKEEGVDHIQMNTNGIKFALSPETMRQIKTSLVLAIFTFRLMELLLELIQRTIGKFHIPFRICKKVRNDGCICANCD